MSSTRSALYVASTVALLFVTGASAPPPARTAQKSTQDATAGTVALAEGASVGDMLKAWTAMTGRKFIWHEGSGLREKRVTMTGTVQHAAADADFVYESMLVSAGLVLIPSGPADAKLFAVEDIDRPAGIKARARFVTRDAFPGLVRFPAEIFSTVIPLKHVAAENLRNALQQILTNRNVEFTMDIPSANALIVVAFGPTLATIGQMLDVLDVEAPVRAPQPPDKK